MTPPEPQSILLIRLSSLGDTLLASPLIRRLRTMYPGARIDMLIESRFADIVRYNPRLSAVFEYDKSASFAQRRALKRRMQKAQPSGKYDLIIDLQRSIRTALFRYRLGTRVNKFDKMRREKVALVKLHKDLYGSVVPVADRYIATAGLPDIAPDGAGLELWLPEERSVADYPPSTRAQPQGQIRRIAIAPGARHATKRWLPIRFAIAAQELALVYQAEIALVGGPDDMELCAAIRSKLPNAIHTLDTSGGSIYDAARCLAESQLLISNDSGAMHIAAARRTPIIALFGSTVREFGFGPYGVPHAVVEENELECRPCTHIGRAACPEGHFRCMRDIVPNRVVHAAYSLLGRSSFP